MKDNQLDLSQYTTDPKRLRGYLKRLDEPQDQDYRTPLGDSAPRETILSRGDDIYDKGSSEHSDIYASLDAGEKEMRSKVGPLSIRVPVSERMDTILEYGDLPQAKEPPTQGIELTIQEYKSLYKSIRLRSWNKVVDKMELSTNSGLPFFTRRRLVLAEVLKNMKDLLAHNYPAVLGGRGQEGGPSIKDVKQRIIFMFPMHVNIAELSFYQPFIEAVQKHKLVPAYVSQDEVEKTMTKLFDTKDKDDLVIATDFTGMDKNFSKSMQEAARQIFAAFLADQDSAGLEEIFPIQFNIGLLCSEDTLVTGEHGEGSGSGGTNATETVSHRALQHQAASDCRTKLNPYSQDIGDDGVLSFKGITVESVVNTYTKYGCIMNPDKQTVSEVYTVYLRRGFHTDYRPDGTMRGIYSTYRALGKLMGQERYYDPKVWSKEMVILRSGSILENVKGHPLFHKLVDFVIEGDKYQLGISLPGFMDRIESKYQEAIAKNPQAFGWMVKSEEQGIKTGAIYNYLKSKAKAR